MIDATLDLPPRKSTQIEVRQRTSTFNGVLLMTVLAAAYFLATEYPADATKATTYLNIEMGLNAVFSTEFLVKFLAFGRRYFRSGYNLLDFTVVLVGWAIYPAGYFFGYMLGAVDADTLNLTYNLADFVNKIAFVLAIWSSAKSSTMDEKKHSGCHSLLV